jgi:CheY-like chemotaxis protein
MLMPVMDGAKFLEEIARQKIPHPPVMMLTANIQEPVRESLLKLGAVDVMAKPFKADQLRAAIDKFSVKKAG